MFKITGRLAPRTTIVTSLMDWVAHLFAALKYSACGFWVCFKEEVAFRQECALAIPHFVAIAVLPLSLSVCVYLTAVWLLLIAIELLNTSIEAVVDLATPNIHRLAKKAKDCASAAVFCVIVLFVGSWLAVLLQMFCES